MKTKTTLAALLLAAVMVTPSYGAHIIFLWGAKQTFERAIGQKKLSDIESFYSLGLFTGYVKAVWHENRLNAPDGVKIDKVCDVVANYIAGHLAESHEPESELIKRAFKAAWPDLNKHVVIKK